MRKSSDIKYKAEFILRVAQTVGFIELALAIEVTIQQLNSKIKGIISISDKELEMTYDLLCKLTVWEKSHV